MTAILVLKCVSDFNKIKTTDAWQALSMCHEKVDELCANLNDANGLVADFIPDLQMGPALMAVGAAAALIGDRQDAIYLARNDSTQGAIEYAHLRRDLAMWSNNRCNAYIEDIRNTGWEFKEKTIRLIAEKDFAVARFHEKYEELIELLHQQEVLDTVIQAAT
jgi:hypothetical protein